MVTSKTDQLINRYIIFFSGILTFGLVLCILKGKLIKNNNNAIQVSFYAFKTLIIQYKKVDKNQTFKRNNLLCVFSLNVLMLNNNILNTIKSETNKSNLSCFFSLNVAV